MPNLEVACFEGEIKVSRFGILSLFAFTVFCLTVDTDIAHDYFDYLR